MPRKARKITHEDRGIECPKCGCRRHRVCYTTPRGDGSVYRVRLCEHCGRKNPTREVLI